jgi:nucleotide-binding universal stress UspA family protein
MREHPEFTLKTIMLATDLSSASYGALDYARNLARQFSAKLLLTHVIDCSPSQKNDVCETIDRAEKELQETVEQLSEDFIESRVIVRQGNIRETILGLIAERKVDLLVLGTRGRTLNAAEGIGSNAEALLRVMPCPVLTIGAKAKTNAFERTHECKIVFPTDFSEGSRIALRYAESLARRLRARLFLVHVEKGSHGYPVMELPHQAQNFRALEKEVREPSVIAECVTLMGSPAETIVAAAIEKDADLIVMRVHQGDQAAGGRLHGLAYEVIASARCPVFTLFVASAQDEVASKELAQSL